MFVFPLGLQAKTRDFPWMTMVILVGTTVFSALNFHLSDKIADAQLNEPAAIERFKKQKALAVSACPASELNSSECDFLKSMVRLESEEGPMAFLARLQAETKKLKKDSEVRPRKLAELVVRPGAFREASPEIRELDEYAPYREAMIVEEAALSKAFESEGLLTKKTFDWETLLKAQFLHDGWWHLISNMLFFLLFAIPLEQRIGSLALAFVYFLGGSTGLTLELFLSSEPLRPLLGASANVSAIGAAFMIAFWMFSVRVWVSMFFVFNHVVLIPTWLFFAVFVVIQDVNGALDLQGGNVAHLAHLGGFGIGILLGAIAAQLKLLSAPFAFPFEGDLFLESRKAQDLGERMKLLREILFYNPVNTIAMVEAWQVLKAGPTQDWVELPKGAKVFLSERFCDLLYYLNKSEKKSMKALLSVADAAAWPSAPLVPQRELTRIMGLIRELETGERHEEALILARMVMNGYPESKETELLKFTERRIETKLQELRNDERGFEPAEPVSGRVG